MYTQITKDHPLYELTTERRHGWWCLSTPRLTWP